MPRFPGTAHRSSERSRLRRIIRLRPDGRLPFGIAAAIIALASILSWAVIIFLIIHAVG